MVIVQEIIIVWHKNERSGENSGARTDSVFKRLIEKAPLKSHECLYDRVRLYQKDKKLYTPAEYYSLMGCGASRHGKREYEPPVLLSQLKVKNISIEECKTGLEVIFSYDRQINGDPPRRGHNRDFNNTASKYYGKDILNETAFVLKNGQKGQIMYNWRAADCDTGQWWYEQAAVNIALVSFEGFILILD